MPNIEKISVALPADMLALVRAAVGSGDYASTSEVIREALREWKGRRATREEAVAEIRRLWREGLATAGRHALDSDDIKREGRRRLAQTRASRGQRGK
jgi:antitoxin ParD1/3/4